MTEPNVKIIWTDYMKYRARLRGFDLARVEQIVRYSNERYVDTETGRLVAIGRIDNMLVMIPFEPAPDSITPVTIHATTRQQVSFRIKTRRFISE